MVTSWRSSGRARILCSEDRGRRRRQRREQARTRGLSNAKLSQVRKCDGSSARRFAQWQGDPVMDRPTVYFQPAGMIRPSENNAPCRAGDWRCERTIDATGWLASWFMRCRRATDIGRFEQSRHVKRRWKLMPDDWRKVVVDTATP